jgi:hypothetical protein
MANATTFQEATRDMFDVTLPEDGNVTLFSLLLKKQKTSIFITESANYFDRFYGNYSKENNTLLWVNQRSEIFSDISNFVREMSDYSIKNVYGWVLVYNDSGKFLYLHNTGMCKPMSASETGSDTMYINY